MPPADADGTVCVIGDSPVRAAEMRRSHAFVGATPMLKAFIVVILGGLGSIPGAVLGGLLIGMIESFGATFLGGVTADMLQLGVVIAILLVRPAGLMGRKEA